jgi:hypothetical protein
MTVQYQLQNSVLTGEPCAVTVVGKGISIPMNPENTDYQAYLAWLEEGNEPLPADESQAE